MRTQLKSALTISGPPVDNLRKKELCIKKVFYLNCYILSTFYSKRIEMFFLGNHRAQQGHTRKMHVLSHLINLIFFSWCSLIWSRLVAVFECVAESPSPRRVNVILPASCVKQFESCLLTRKIYCIVCRLKWITTLLVENQDKRLTFEQLNFSMQWCLDMPSFC